MEGGRTSDMLVTTTVHLTHDTTPRPPIRYNTIRTRVFVVLVTNYTDKRAREGIKQMKCY